MPALKVAAEAASDIIDTFELSVKGEASVMIARSLYFVVELYCGWIQKVAWRRAHREEQSHVVVDALDIGMARKRQAHHRRTLC